jgi:hypothetical protein
VFEQLQREQIVRVRIEAFSLDSNSVKVHPDGTGALKKRLVRGICGSGFEESMQLAAGGVEGALLIV